MRSIKRFSAVLFLVLCISLPQLLFALPADGVTPVNNRDYVKAVHKLIKGAKSEIRIMLYQAWFYEDFPDSDSNNFLRELIAAKKRGIDVEILMETSNWNSNLEKNNRDFARRLKEGGVKVRFDHEEITSHQKVIIVDQCATMVASNNWSHFSLWVNNEVAVIVWSRPVAAAFLDYMDARTKEAGHQLCARKPVNARIAPGDFKMLPCEDVVPAANREYFLLVHKAMGQAKKDIRLVQRSANYYTTRPLYAQEKDVKPGEPVSHLNVLLKDMILARKRGVSVEATLDAELRKSKSRKKWVVDNKNEDFAIRLLAGDVTVYYDSLTTQTHAKMVIVDDLSFVGSTNWTYNALHQGNEVSVMIKSPEVAAYYRDYFDELKKAGLKVEPGLDLHALMRKKRDADQ